MNPTRYYKTWIVLFIAAFALCAWRVIDRGHNWGGDFALYISQCKAIDQGTTQQLLEASAASCDKSYIVINPALYPPAFPLMLLPLYKVFGMNLYVFKLIPVLCYLGCIACIGYFFYRKLGRTESLLAISLFVSSVFFIAFCNNIIADMPVWLVCLVTLNVIPFYHPEQRGKKLVKGIALGVLFATGYLIKSLGVSLMATYFIYEGYFFLSEFTNRKTINTQKIWYDLVTPAIVFVLLVFAAGVLYPTIGSDYVQYAKGLGPEQVKENIYYYFHAPKWFLFHSNLFWLLTLPFVVYGMIRNRKQDAFHLLFMGLHFLMLILWPYLGGLRYAFFLVPYYFYFSFAGYRYFFEWLTGKTARQWFSFRYIVFIIAAGYSFFDLARAVADPLPLSEDVISKASTQELFSFIKQNTQPHEQFIFFKPNVLRLFCERESFYQVSTEGIRNSDATYWIHWKDDVLADTTGLPVLLHNEEFTVYRLK